MTPISSTNNPIIKHAHALLTQHRARKKNAQTVLEGIHLIEAYLEKGLIPTHVLIGEAAVAHDEVCSLLAHIPAKNTLFVSNALYKKIRTLGDGIDIMAIIDIPMLSITNTTSIDGDCLILDRLQDAGNIGTLLRTASAVGIVDVITTPTTASLWSPKCLRAGMGAQFSLHVVEHIGFADIIHIVKAPFYATSSHGNHIIYHHNLTAPVAWVLGHEGQGVGHDFMQIATPITLPQPNGQESLNVGIAGSLCFYEMLRQRQFC